MMTAEDERVPDPLLGRTLAERYKLTRKIGEGGMGSVYEATHVVLGKSVAVKVLREKYADRPAVAQRLVQEARLASAIRHDHIIDITDSGKTEDGRTFVVMELIEGPSLAELLRREGALPEARALGIVLQVAGALGAAHARGIVHRDVKPENILLSPRGGHDFVKVVDFGISKTLRPGESEADVGRLTSTGMVLGTPFYMSPEQARGDEEVDLRIDVYALGVILYECLTGEVPFRGPNYLGILQRVSNDEATPPRQLRPEMSISEAAERVCAKAMCKNRDARYPSMEALADDVVRVLEGRPIDALPPIDTPRARPRIGLAVVGAIATVATVTAIVLFLRPRPAPTPIFVPSPAPIPQPKVVAPPAEPASVVLHVDTDPQGAEVRQGDRVFGPAPLDVTLPRSTEKVQLTFFLNGYELGSFDAIPSANDSIHIKLKKKPHHGHPQPPTATKTQPAKPDTSGPAKETLPNPYQHKP